MNLNKYKIIIVITVLALIFITNYPLINKYIYFKSEEFFSLYTLDKDGKTYSYFIEDSNMYLNNFTDWTIVVENNMNKIQYVKIIIKIFNLTNMNDDIYSGVPNSSPILYEQTHYILNDQNWEHKIQWYITGIENNDDFTEIRKIVINEKEIDTSILSRNGEDFIFLIELWPYNPERNNFSFTWESNNKIDCTWNKIWFNTII